MMGTVLSAISSLPDVVAVLRKVRPFCVAKVDLLISNLIRVREALWTSGEHMLHSFTFLDDLPTGARGCTGHLRTRYSP
jgi:hypothetical protein